jgi:predicted RNA-binding Zn ribbon-like protein
VVKPTSICDAAPAKKFQFVGRKLCLDFCNTVGGKRGVATREHLHSYDDWLSWCAQAELIDSSTFARLFKKGIRRPTEAAKVYARALALREAIFDIFSALADSKAPPANCIRLLNAELARSSGRLRISFNTRQDEFSWDWALENSPLDGPLGPIARSAADLLVSGSWRGHIRMCQACDCGWLFLDSSKNHSRRWCDMRDCGNRAKVRRHRLKSEL